SWRRLSSLRPEEWRFRLEDKEVGEGAAPPRTLAQIATAAVREPLVALAIFPPLSSSSANNLFPPSAVVLHRSGRALRSHHKERPLSFFGPTESEESLMSDRNVE
ncbi:hypothetical protein GW17_00044269, partial [Ensete ventricosum]